MLYRKKTVRPKPRLHPRNLGDGNGKSTGSGTHSDQRHGLSIPRRGRLLGLLASIGSGRERSHRGRCSGVASVIKVVLAMRRGLIPKYLHFHNPNPEIDWERKPLRVTSEATEWPHVAGRPPICIAWRRPRVRRTSMLADVVAAVLAGLPDPRRLRVLEVGAGTGSATASALPHLPAGRFDGQDLAELGRMVVFSGLSSAAPAVAAPSEPRLRPSCR